MKKLFILVSILSLLIISACSAKTNKEIQTSEPAAGITAEISQVKTDDYHVTQLIARIKDESLKKEDRIAAMKELGEIGDPMAVEPLIELLKDYWYDAIKPLGDIGDPRAIDALIEVQKRSGSDADIMRYFPNDVIEAFKKIGDPSVEKLISSLNDTQNSFEKSCIIKALGELRDPRTIEPLLGYLKSNTRLSDDCRIYISVREALVNIGSPATEALIGFVKNNPANVREEGILILGQIKDKRAVEPLISLLKSTEELDFYTREEIAKALGSIGDERAVEPLIELFKSDDIYSSLKAYVEALGMIGNTKSINYLEAVANNRKDERWKLAYLGLAQSGAPRAKEMLNNALDTGDLEVISVAYAHYIWVGKAGSEKKIIEAMTKYGNQEMTLALLNSGNPELVDAAKKYADEKDYPFYTVPGEKSDLTWGQGS